MLKSTMKLTPRVIVEDLGDKQLPETPITVDEQSHKAGTHHTMLYSYCVFHIPGTFP
jgi:hypothetical protein